MTKSLKEWMTQVTNMFIGNSKVVASSPTLSSLRNCTGTGALFLMLTQAQSGGPVFINGRVNIASYARTDANPGVYITLPSSVATPTKTANYCIGANAQFPREVVQITLTANSRTAIIFTSETFNNHTGNLLTFICNGQFYLN